MTCVNPSCGAPLPTDWRVDVCPPCLVVFRRDGDTWEYNDRWAVATRQAIFAARLGAEVYHLEEDV